MGTYVSYKAITNTWIQVNVLLIFFNLSEHMISARPSSSLQCVEMRGSMNCVLFQVNFSV